MLDFETLYSTSFSFAGLKPSLADHVSRAAVYHPLVGTLKHDDQELKQVSQVVSHWRMLLAKVNSVDRPWTFAVANTMHNCIPCGIWTNPRRNTCNARYLCPFCYGRSVADVFTRFKSVIHGMPRTDRQKLRLTAVVRIAELGGLGKRRLARLREALRSAKKYAAGFIPWSGASTGYMQIVAEPINDSWRITTRSLAITGDMQAAKIPCRSPWYQETPSAPLSKIKACARLVGTVLRYPRRLFKATPEQLLEYLRIRRGIQTSAMYGDLRTYRLQSPSLTAEGDSAELSGAPTDSIPRPATAPTGPDYLSEMLKDI